MTKYSVAFSVAGVNAANGVLANLKATATDRLTVLEVGMFIETAPTTAPILALQRMAAVGTGAITTTPGALHDMADAASNGLLEIAWATTRPTLTANTIIRRGQLPVTVGGGFIWDFSSRPLIVPLNGGLCLIDINASGATLGQFGGYITWDE